MRKLFSLPVFLSLFLLISFSGCRKVEKGAIASDEASREAATELQVVQANPKGITEAPHEVEIVVVIFNQPMVPLEALPEGKGSSFLKIDPETPGKHRWKGTRVLTFTPEKRFPFATEIRVTIPAGVKSLQGQVLAQDFSWSFQTMRPRVVKHIPWKEQSWVKLESPVFLFFNQPVPDIKAKDFLSLVEIDQQNQERTIPFSVRHPGAKLLKEQEEEVSSEEVLLLEPKEKFKLDATCYVEVREGFPGREGALGMEKSYIFSFETLRSFRFEQLEISQPHNPYDPLEFIFSNPVKYSEFVKRIHFEPEVKIPDYYSEWTHSDSRLYILLPFKPEVEYSLRVDPELEDDFGNRLGREARKGFRTAPYPPSVDLPGGHGIVEAYGNLQYPVTVMNTPKVFFQAAVIGQDEVIPLLKTERIFWSSEMFTPKKGFFRIEKPLSLPISRNKRQVFPLGLKEFLADSYGLVFLQLDTFLPDNWDRFPKALLQVTDLGITAKFSPENNLVWVTELKTGKPVPEAEVEVRDDSNSVLWRGRTDKEGKAKTPGWKALGIKARDTWRNPLQWVFVKRGRDTAFISSDWGTGVYPYRFGVHYDWSPQPEKTKGYLFTDRGIYRAGEEVHFKGILRRVVKEGLVLPSLKEVDCEIQDPYSKSVYKNTAEVDQFGSFDFDFRVDEEASLGRYEVTVIVPTEEREGKGTVISGSFQIEAFRPAEFEVLLRTGRESNIFGDEYKAEVRASYLYGGAMSGQKVSWHLRLNPTAFIPPGHKGYIFGNEIDRWEWGEREESRLIGSGEGELNSEGKFEVRARLIPEKERDSVEAALEATVQGPSRASITNRVQTVVHRGEFYIGLKPGTTLLDKGNELGVDVISVDEKGLMIPDVNISVTLLKREWHSVQKKGIGAGYDWETRKEDTEVASRKVKTGNKPQTISFLPDKAGFYLLRAQAEDKRSNPVSTTTSLYVTGRDYVPWERSDDDTIELVADQERYRPGDKAKILVKSPYEKAKALVTLERESILDSRILELEGSANSIEIPILSDYIPNVFVSVILVQGRMSEPPLDGSEDIGKPSFKVGYAELTIDPSQKRLSLSIEKDQDNYKPRDTVTLRLRVRDSEGKGKRASITLAVVDLGVINLIGYKIPDLFQNFYSPRALSVATSETRLHILAQRVYGEKGEDVGGGGEEFMKALAGGIGEVELRGDFKPTAYWNPSVLVGDNGEATVSFTLPDNLTTFQVMAFAQTKESQFGWQESSFRVSKPLLLLPSLPRFARVGDTFQGGVVVHNYSSQSGAVKVNCEYEGIALLDMKPTREFSLDPGQSREALFTFEARQTGQARFALRARMGEESDGLEVTIPVKLPRPTETVALFHQTDKSLEELVTIPEDIYPSESKIAVYTSASALSGLKENLDYLADYPYLCLEQRLSSVLPFIVASDIIRDFNLSKFDEKEMKDYVVKTISELYLYQRDSGGFALWTDSPHDSPFITCYAAFALAKAREAGYAVHNQSLQDVVRYLRNFMRKERAKEEYPLSESDWETTRAYALYCLALLESPEPSYGEILFSRRDQLSLFGQTLLLKALTHGKGSHSAINTLRDELMNKVKVEGETAHFEDGEGRSWIYSSNLRTTALILQAMVEAGTQGPLLPPVARWLIEKRKASRWHSTQENFYLFYALNSFYRAYEKTTPDFTAEVSLAEKLLLKEIYEKQRSKTATAEISLAELKQRKTVPLKIKKKGEGLLYYGARMTYALQKKAAPRDEGIAVYKRIESLDGKPLDTIRAGSLVVVTLEIILPQESLYVVVNDPLPAGFEAVNPVFLTESQEELRRLEQREGRDVSWWWEGFTHVEMYDDRVLLFADSLRPGVHTHRYLARALSFGQFQTPGTTAEEMYSPEVFGRTAESIVKIVR